MKSLNIVIDSTSKVKIYHQISSQIKQMIEEGTIPTNTKIPSVRSLATDLIVSKNTVIKAYEELSKDGYIFSASKSGFYTKNPKDETYSFLTNYERSDDSETVLRVIPKSEEIQNLLYVNFKKNLKTEQAKEILSKNLKNDDDSYFKQVICYFLTSFVGLQVKPENIVVCDNNYQLISNILSLPSLKKNNQVLINKFTTSQNRNFLLDIDYNFVELQPSEIGFNIDDINQESSKILYFTNNEIPAFKLNTPSVQTEIQNYLDWTNKKSGYILEINNFTDNNPLSIKSFDKDNRVILITSFKEALSPLFNACFAILNDDLVKEYNTLYSNFGVQLSKIEQIMISEIIYNQNIIQ